MSVGGSDGGEGREQMGWDLVKLRQDNQLKSFKNPLSLPTPQCLLSNSFCYWYLQVKHSARIFEVFCSRILLLVLECFHCFQDKL